VIHSDNKTNEMR